jgi:hypothetical protein
MKRILVIATFFISCHLSHAKLRPVSLKSLIDQSKYIFGAELVSIIKTHPKNVNSDVFATVRIIQSIKNPPDKKTICIKYMYDDCTGITAYNADGIQYLLCMVSKSKNDTVYENLQLGSIKSFDTFESYQLWMEYVSGAYNWIINRTARKEDLKNAWLRKYLLDSTFQNHLLFELDDSPKDYAPISSENQTIIKDHIISNFDHTFDLEGFRALKGKPRTEVLTWAVTKLTLHADTTCSLMEMLHFYVDNRKLYDLWEQFCESTENQINDEQKLIILQKFKTEILK